MQLVEALFLLPQMTTKHPRLGKHSTKMATFSTVSSMAKQWRKCHLRPARAKHCLLQRWLDGVRPSRAVLLEQARVARNLA